MNYITECNLVEEKLEWDSFIPAGARKLIIGTFPTVKKRRDFEFFYPNKNNCFWKVLSIIANHELIPSDKNGAIMNRKEILKKLNLGITDMGYKILRHDNSSLDQSIIPIEFMNIFRILNENPKIQKLIFTSSSGKNSVEGWFRSYCKLNSINIPKLKGRNPKKTKFNFEGKIINIVSVHSTSGLAGRKLEELTKMYRKEIIES